MFWNIVAYVGLTIISILLAPKPPSPKPAELSDSDVPTAEPGSPIPVVFGTVEISGANVVWWGDTSTTDIVKCGSKK